MSLTSLESSCSINTEDSPLLGVKYATTMKFKGPQSDYETVDGHDEQLEATQDESLSISPEGSFSEDETQEQDNATHTLPLVPSNVRLAQRLIYVSHFVSQFSECAWAFAVVLFLAAVSHYQSILIVSSYYLTTYVTLMLFGAPVGKWLDTTNRLQAARLCIGIENGAVLVATLACCWLLTKTEHSPNYNGDTTTESAHIPHDGLSILLLVVVHIFGSLAMLLDQSFVVAIERDWIVVLSQQTSEPEAWLSKTNVTLRQIYLSCKVVSPAFAGWIVSLGSSSSSRHRFCDLHSAALLVGVLCVTSLFFEYVCTIRVYRLVPALAVLSIPQQESQHGSDNKNDDDDNCSSLCVYWKQPIVWAGLSLAFMSANALCFGGAMTTFLLWEGMPVEQVGLWRGISSAIGLAGTFAYRFSASRTTVVNTGAWSVVYLFGCLTLACSSFLIPQDDQKEYNPTSVYLLVASTAASRIGLWVFDISVTLLYQELVPDGVRSLIGGTQQSLNSFFTMGSGCLGLIFHTPEQFYIIAFAGYFCIGMSMLLYIIGVYRRGQVFFQEQHGLVAAERKQQEQQLESQQDDEQLEILAIT